MAKDREDKTIVELMEICKTFGPTKALQDVNLSIHPGDIVGLVGANGAGKSTLMKILTGVYTPTKGSIIFHDNETIHHYSAICAKNHGIACAYQELSLCTNLSVYENFVLKKTSHNILEKPGWRKAAIADTTAIMNEVFPNADIDVRQELGNLTLDKRQMVEICAALSQKNLSILVLDEPTSSLTVNRINQLHDKVRQLSEAGIAVIYISHKIDEIVNVCNRVIIMNSGRQVWSGNINETSVGDLVKKMGGNPSSRFERKESVAGTTDILSFEHYSSDKLKDINLHVKKGEIIGVSGLVGSGQRELINIIFNSSRADKKRGLRITGKVSYVSGDRNTEGIFSFWNIADNINISSLRNISKYGFLHSKDCNSAAETWYDKLKFKARGIHDDIASLSGGNQQKALIARCLASDAAIIVLNDPTCGVDVETKKDIYLLLQEAADAGRTIIWHSTEDLEMEQCDRVLIMQNGCITSELAGSEISVNNIIAASFKPNEIKDIHNETEDKRNGKVSLDSRMLMPIIIFLLIFSITIILRPSILSYSGVKLLFKSAVPLVFVGLGQMFMVVSGGMDLSNGMALGLVNVVTAFTLGTNPSLGIFFLLLVIIGYGVIGALIYVTKIPPIVVTLGAAYVWLGFGLMVSSTPGGKCPAWLAAIYNFNLPVVPMCIVLALLGGVASYWIIMKSKYGIVIRGAGNNSAAVIRAGWSQRVTIIATYMISGLFVVIAGLLVTAVANGGDCNAYGSYQLLSIATIIIGGCELAGGICTPLGVVIGALSLSCITTLLTFMNISSNLQSAVMGAILMLALTIKLLSRKRVK